eukprot:2020163-Amphidinium_carterae.2
MTVGQEAVASTIFQQDSRIFDRLRLAERQQLNLRHTPSLLRSEAAGLQSLLQAPSSTRAASICKAPLIMNRK